MSSPARPFVAVVGAMIVAAACLAGCKGHTTVGPGRTVTVTPSASPTTTTPDASPSASTSSVPPPVSLGSPPSRMTSFRTDCADALPDERVTAALGGLTLPGDTAFVVGLPDAQTGRVSYLNCRYGVKSGVPHVEINVSLYRTSAQANDRIAPTVQDFTAHGATSAGVGVSDQQATILTGGQGAGYGATILMAYGQRTIAVTLADGAVPAAFVQAALVSLAALAAQRTTS